MFCVAQIPALFYLTAKNVSEFSSSGLFVGQPSLQNVFVIVVVLIFLINFY